MPAGGGLKGREKSASTSSVLGLSMYRCGPAVADTQVATRRPRESKVSVMQTWLSSVAENVKGLRPSGPRRV
jgi:hypothetical protein